MIRRGDSDECDFGGVLRLVVDRALDPDSDGYPSAIRREDDQGAGLAGVDRCVEKVGCNFDAARNEACLWGRRIKRDEVEGFPLVYRS